MAKLVLDFEKSDETKMQITDDDIMSVNSISQSTSDSSTINYGCIASTGSITIQDKWNQLEEMVLNEDIPASNANIDIIVNDNVLQSHISSYSSFDNTSNELNIQLTNKIGEWDTLKYKGYAYPDESRTLYQILEDVLGSLGYTQSQIEHSTSNQIVYTGVDNSGNKTTNVGSVAEYLKNIKVEYPSIEYGKTYRQVIDEICIVAQLRCFIDDDNNLKFISGRPLISELDTPIEIPLSVVLDDISGDLFVKNKYDDVEIDEVSVGDNVDIETVLYTWKDKDNEFQSNTTSDSDEKTTSASGVSIYSYVKVTATYYTGTIKFKKKSGDNLQQILSVLDGVDSSGNPRIKYNVNYIHKSGGVNVVSTGEQFFITPNYTSSYEGSGSLATYSTISTAVGSTISASLNDETNLKTIKITSDEDYYYTTFKVLVGYTKINGSYSQTPYTLSGSSESYEPKSIEVSLYGNKRTITFSNTSASGDLSNAKTVASVQQSSLLQDKTTFNGKIKMSEIIKHNILSDYENGTRSLSFRTVCSDLYDSEGNKVVDFKNGEVLQNGNLVYLKNDNLNIYTVYSREFIYDGSPETALMVESNKIIYYYGLYKSGNMVSGWGELIKTGKLNVSNGIITSSAIESADGDKLLVKNTITGIGSNAFAGSKIDEIELPDSVTSIGSGAFKGSWIYKFKFPSKITTISSYMFAECPYLYDIDVRKITQISSYAFQKVGHGINTIWFDLYNITYIGSYAFSEMNSEAVFDFGPNLSTISSYAFYKNTRLKEIRLDNCSKLNAISDATFNGCTELETFVLPSSFKGPINSNAFKGCSNLKNIYLNSNISDVYGSMSMYQNGSFYGCSNLTVYTNIINKFNINSVSFGTKSGCSVSASNRVITMTTSADNQNPYFDILTTTLTSGDWTISCSSLTGDEFAIGVIINGSVYAKSNSSVKVILPLYINQSSVSATIRIYGREGSNYLDKQCFSDIIVTDGYKDDDKNKICKWQEGWSIYNVADGSDGQKVFKAFNVRYGYTLDQYKSEAGID